MKKLQTLIKSVKQYFTKSRYFLVVFRYDDGVGNCYWTGGFPNKQNIDVNLKCNGINDVVITNIIEMSKSDFQRFRKEVKQ